MYKITPTTPPEVRRKHELDLELRVAALCGHLTVKLTEEEMKRFIERLVMTLGEDGICDADLRVLTRMYYRECCGRTRNEN